VARDELVGQAIELGRAHAGHDSWRQVVERRRGELAALPHAVDFHGGLDRHHVACSLTEVWLSRGRPGQGFQESSTSRHFVNLWADSPLIQRIPDSSKVRVQMRRALG
jgi:hypothetical protein